MLAVNRTPVSGSFRAFIVRSITLPLPYSCAEKYLIIFGTKVKASSFAFVSWGSLGERKISRTESTQESSWKLSHAFSGIHSGTPPIAGVMTLSQQHFPSGFISESGEIGCQTDADQLIALLRHSDSNRCRGLFWPVT